MEFPVFLPKSMRHPPPFATNSPNSPKICRKSPSFHPFKRLAGFPITLSFPSTLSFPITLSSPILPSIPITPSSLNTPSSPSSPSFPIIPITPSSPITPIPLPLSSPLLRRGAGGEASSLRVPPPAWSPGALLQLLHPPEPCGWGRD